MTIVKLVIYVLVFFWLFTPKAISQNQKDADSLIELYNSGEYQDKTTDLLKNIAHNETNPDVKLQYCEVLIKKATEESLIDVLQNAYAKKGDALQSKGDYVQANNAYFKSIEYAKRLKNQSLIGDVTISIANTYSMIGNSESAESYYDKGIQIIRKVNDSIALGSALLNAGDEYFHSGKYDKALLYFEESGIIFNKIDYPIGTAYNLGNVGMVYAEQGKDELATENINNAIAMLEELQDYYPISVYLTYMADIYAKHDNIKTAIDYAERSLQLASMHGLKEQISDANLKLSELYEKAGKNDKAYPYFKNHIVYRDSVKNIETVEKMANAEVSIKQLEVDKLSQQKKNQRIIVYATILAALLTAFLAYGMFKRYKFIRATNIIIEKERNKSDHLLLNILPEETAQELKNNGKVQAKKFESVTVLFTDFKEFTKYAEILSPEDLVESVDYYFTKFDEIIEKYDLEKIKTIGDSYMCASGLPFPTQDHAQKMVMAALEIADFVNTTKSQNLESQIHYDVRIGINTGPVVAGVVGSKKFAYDIWGDAVNIASRMEINSEPGKINISEFTYELIKNEFDCEFRGEVEVKNRGMLKMYFVNGNLVSSNDF